MPKNLPERFEAQLRTLGVSGSADIALDATITPETFAAARASGRPPPARPGPSVGPLPRIALSGGSMASGESAANPASADLEILGLLGEGGMGRVHLARQRSLGREVALKTLKEDVADVRSVEMLHAEATVMGRLEHPNVVPVHAIGLDDAGRLVLVMKRIDGAPWRELLRDPHHPRWPALAARVEDRLEAHLDVLGQVAGALHFAHERGVIHRDVKPENVLVGPHGEVYLSDWGIAMRMDEALGTELVGTPGYMAPEMTVGDRRQLGPHTDVFLLGATLHEILTGSPPYAEPTLQTTLLAAYEAEPRAYAATVPSELVAIARKAMSRAPEERFGSALELRRALEALRTHRTSLTLTRAAERLLGELEAGVPPNERDRKLTECRFAATSALREWPENEAARAVLARTLRQAIAHEIGREGAEAARALLAELEGGDAELEARLRRLEAELASRRDAAARLKALESEGDLRVGFGARAALFAGSALAGLVELSFAVRGGSSPRTSWDLAWNGGVLAVVLSLLLVPLARQQLANAIGRRVMVFYAATILGVLVHRLVAASWGVPAGATLSMDLALVTVLMAAASTLLPRVGWTALPALAGTALSVAFPGSVDAIFPLSMLGVVLTAAAIGSAELRRTRRGNETD